MRQTRSWLGEQSGTDSDRVSPTLLGYLGPVVASVLVSVVGYSLLPGEIQIHWTLGAGPYYGPEFAPTALVLAVFPVLLAGIVLSARWCATRLALAEEPAIVRRLYALAVVGTSLLLLVVQVGLVVANL